MLFASASFLKETGPVHHPRIGELGLTAIDPQPAFSRGIIPGSSV